MSFKKTKSINHGGKRVSEILEAHQLFFSGKEGGVRADLQAADLSGADLEGANLSGALMQNANLEATQLSEGKIGLSPSRQQDRLTGRLRGAWILPRTRDSLWLSHSSGVSCRHPVLNSTARPRANACCRCCARC